MSAALRIEPGRQDSDEILARVQRMAAPPTSLHAFVRAVETEPSRAPARRLTSVDISEAKSFVQGYARKLREQEALLLDYEQRFKDLAQRSAAEMHDMQSRLDASQAETRAALARGDDAEARAHEAETLLKNLVATIETEFTGPANHG